MAEQTHQIFQFANRLLGLPFHGISNPQFLVRGQKSRVKLQDLQKRILRFRIVALKIMEPADVGADDHGERVQALRLTHVLFGRAKIAATREHNSVDMVRVRVVGIEGQRFLELALRRFPVPGIFPQSESQRSVRRRQGRIQLKRAACGGLRIWPRLAAGHFIVVAKQIVCDCLAGISVSEFGIQGDGLVEHLEALLQLIIGAVIVEVVHAAEIGFVGPHVDRMRLLAPEHECGRESNLDSSRDGLSEVVFQGENVAGVALKRLGPEVSIVPG